MADPALQQQLTDLQQAFDAQRDTRERSPVVQQHLRAFKLALAKAGLLFADPSANPHDLVAARSGLEIGAFYSLRVHDVKEFERYYASLQVFYRDLAHILPPSHSYYPVLGLELLTLLSTGRLTEFHTLLESLDPSVLKDEFVSWPIDLERWLMEGAYNKVYHARERLPREEYEVLIVTLLTTVRSQIADTVEASYPSLPLANTATLLFFKEGETEQLMTYAKERGWTLNPTTSTFTFERSRIEPDAAAGLRPGDALHNLIEPALKLAHQLEAIV